MRNSLLTDTTDSNNDSNTSLRIDLENSEFEASMHHLKWVAYGIIAPILIAVGVVGNLLNLAVLTRPNLKGVMYTYLTWLAISDMMSLVFTIPTILRFVGSNLTDYYSAFYHAHVELAIVNAFMACSVFIVVAVTVDRYVSVSKPTKYRDVHTPDRARLWIVTSYASSFLFYVPVCFFKQVHSERADSGEVRYQVRENFAVSGTPAWTVYLYVKESLVRLGPVVLLTFLNVMIIVSYQKIVRKRKALFHASRLSYLTAGLDGAAAGGGSGGQREMASLAEERRLVMLLIAVVVMFVITMTPAAFLTLFMTNEKERSFSFQAFRAFANNMEFVNYAMNFYLYCLCSKDFRSTFLQMFHFLKANSYVRGRSSNSLEGAGRQNLDVVLDEQPTTTIIDSKI